jgi:uncharacterized protein (DUF4415 family)
MNEHDKLTPPTADEVDAIERGITQDPDNPEWTEDDFRRARPAHEALSEIFGEENAEQLLKRTPGRPPKEDAKERITIRLDADILEWLKNQGPGYQTKINTILRNEMENRV